MATNVNAHQSGLIVHHRPFDESDYMYSGLQVAPDTSNAQDHTASAPEVYDASAADSQGQPLGTTATQHEKQWERSPTPGFTSPQSATSPHYAGLEAVHPYSGDVDVERGLAEESEARHRGTRCCGLRRKTACIIAAILISLVIIGVGVGVGLGLGLKHNSTSPDADSTADSDSSGICPKYDGKSQSFFDSGDDLSWGRSYTIECGLDAAVASTSRPLWPGNSSSVTADFKACIFKCDQQSGCFLFSYTFPDHNCTMLKADPVTMAYMYDLENWAVDPEAASGWA
ncbi:uncharacterized protein F5Z01DRAFT_662376 [Emericellopsis atlantica]|uniref:Apple domain-containing protein n=1 Tax=Emericellopsis atlantica TaxID=2614577 RepID=A0A9P7ZHY7_9HYPO|nr:uncharacterized protein F5Z01DRAFT_662376 [Emericellopsis atlantica]KAG9251900.1 hypothetical protein F5Z01DRAFT_662376 [Emericellopsis atlantica]